MEIKIGLKDVAREVVLESSENAGEISRQVAEAIENKTLLKLTDAKGNLTGDGVWTYVIGDRPRFWGPAAL